MQDRGRSNPRAAPWTSPQPWNLDGIWTNTSLTTLERRPELASVVVPDAEAEVFIAEKVRQEEAGAVPRDLDRPPPVVGEVDSIHSEWWDRGRRLSHIKGSFRSAWLIDPPDGKLPYRQNVKLDPLAGLVSHDMRGPEARPTAERCLLGGGSPAGPPLLNPGYNALYKIVQTPDAVAILVEMNHDVRIVRLRAEHAPAALQPWMGDSVGRWEGRSLVVETRHFNPGERARPAFNLFISPSAKVTERFTRTSRDEILYEFRVDDPDLYRSPWRGEMVLQRVDGPLYEYACHEGNYAMTFILSGARAAEAATETKPPQPVAN